MKKILIFLLTTAICLSLAAFTASASLLEDANGNGISDGVEQAINNSPEISSLVDAFNNGDLSAENIGSRLIDALRKIEGVDVDQLLKGLNGLDENDGLLGKLASLIGPNSNGLSGVLSNIGNAFSSGAADLSGGSIGGILSGIFGNIGNFGSTSATEAPTVHTTAATASQTAAPATIYSPSFNTGSVYSASSYGTAPQYTVPYTMATAVPVTDVTTQAYIIPTETLPQVPVVTTDVSEQTAEVQQKRSANWKKIVGAVLVFGSFAAIAAVVIKKSM